MYKDEALKSGKEESAIKLLIQELSGYTSSKLYLNYDQEVEEKLEKEIIAAINKYLIEDIPAQYILGYTYFYNLKLKVNSAVLIPRRETEELIENIINIWKKPDPKILEIGTGSGAIAAVLRKYYKNSSIVASDISIEALKVASENAKNNNLEIEFIQSDIFQNIKGKYNIIVSNPPYIASKEDTDVFVYKNEPHQALFASQQGLYFYIEILKDVHKFLEDEFLIAFEIPEDRDSELVGLVNQYFPSYSYAIKKDLQLKSRILIIESRSR